MKIAESNIMYFSNASYQQTSDETVYNFDKNKLVLEKEKTQTKKFRHTTAAAHYHTNTDDVTTLKYAPETHISKEIKTGEQPETGLEDDFEKNFYTASVLNWAADTIDELVSAFKLEKESLDSPAAKTTVVPEVSPPSFADSPLESSTLSEQRIKIYQEMASSLRAKAQALLPEAPVSAASRLLRTLSSEKESLNLQAQGMIQTMDGQEIGFSLDLQMHRKNVTQTTQTILIDPLIINFDNDFASLTDEKIYFDLDSDGMPEQISTLQEGSGFLALDINKDGRINNGLELFGPNTGDGFGELSLFDSDNNNWIDENDPIYDDLLVWIKKDSKNDILKKLAETGIGAIHLGSVESQFTMMGEKDQILGEIAQTGIALTEDGTAKTIQQVNLIV